jgi:hypothetical protein
MMPITCQHISSSDLESTSWLHRGPLSIVLFIKPDIQLLVYYMVLKSKGRNQFLRHFLNLGSIECNLYWKFLNFL